MTDPPRLLEEDDGSFDLALLRAGRGDGPRAAAVASALMALTASGGAFGAGSVALGTAGRIVNASTAIIAKWFVVGVASGLVATGGLHYVAEGTRSPQAVPGSGPPRAASLSRGLAPPFPASDAVLPQPVPAPRPQAVAVAAMPAVDPSSARPPGTLAARPGRTAVPLQPPAAVSPSEAAPPASGAVSRSPAPSLSAELALLESARTSLLAHKPDAVFQTLSVYDGMAKTGVLDSEAEMLRIEALLEQGNVAAARARSSRALVTNPAGAHAARLREILGQPPGE